MNAVESDRKYFYFVDQKKYETESNSITGGEIKVKIPNFDPSYSLWVQGHGGEPDHIVPDTESFSLERQDKGELHFYTVPPVSFGNHARI